MKWSLGVREYGIEGDSYRKLVGLDGNGFQKPFLSPSLQKVRGGNRFWDGQKGLKVENGLMWNGG